MNDIEQSIDILVGMADDYGKDSIQDIALSEGITALEKQLPKKPNGISVTHEGNVANCPACGRFIRHIENTCYCNHEGCGQALKWSEETLNT